MVLLAMAAFPVLAGAAILSAGPRRRYALMTLTAAAGMLLVVGPHYLYVRELTLASRPPSTTSGSASAADVLSPSPT